MKPHTQPSPAPLDDCSEPEWIQQAIAGNDQAFALIMRRHNRLVFRSVRSILKNDDDAQDAVQEAYLRAWRALASFRADAKLSTWLVRIAVNEALGRLRKQGGHIIPLTAAQHDDGHPAEHHATETPMQAHSSEQPESSAMRAQARQHMEARIDALPAQFRSVFMLRGVEEMSVEEVATALDIPLATVRSRFFRAKGLLREGLARDMDMAVNDAFSFAGSRCDRIVGHVLEKIAQERGAVRS